MATVCARVNPLIVRRSGRRGLESTGKDSARASLRWDFTAGDGVGLGSLRLPRFESSDSSIVGVNDRLFLGLGGCVEEESMLLWFLVLLIPPV